MVSRIFQHTVVQSDVHTLFMQNIVTFNTMRYRSEKLRMV